MHKIIEKAAAVNNAMLPTPTVFIRVYQHQRLMHRNKEAGKALTLLQSSPFFLPQITFIRAFSL